VEISLGEDSGENGKGRDAHCRAEEKRHGGESHRWHRVEEVGVENHGDQRARQKRRHDTGVADDDGGVSAVAEKLGVEFQADQEQEEDHADLAERVEILNALIGKNFLESPGHEQPEEAWPQHDARNHFPHHLRLAKADKQESHDPAEAKDQAYLHDKKENEISGLHSEWLHSAAMPAVVERAIVKERSLLVPFAVVDMFLKGAIDRKRQGAGI